MKQNPKAEAKTASFQIIKLNLTKTTTIHLAPVWKGLEPVGILGWGG